jgi:hypothetical protein
MKKIELYKEKHVRITTKATRLKVTIIQTHLKTTKRNTSQPDIYISRSQNKHLKVIIKRHASRPQRETPQGYDLRETSHLVENNLSTFDYSRYVRDIDQF